jgi:hypothetical protein
MQRRRWLLLVLAAALMPLVAGCGSSPASAQKILSSPLAEASQQPPAWLFDLMRRAAHGVDSNATSVWWTRTNNAKALAIVDQLNQPGVKPEKSVYLVIMNGTFYPFSNPGGVTPQAYQWSLTVIDATSHLADLRGLWNKPFDTSGLEMHEVALPSSPQPVTPEASGS